MEVARKWDLEKWFSVHLAQQCASWLLGLRSPFYRCQSWTSVHRLDSDSWTFDEVPRPLPRQQRFRCCSHSFGFHDIGLQNYEQEWNPLLKRNKEVIGCTTFALFEKVIRCAIDFYVTKCSASKIIHQQQRLGARKKKILIMQCITYSLWLKASRLIPTITVIWI